MIAARGSAAIIGAIVGDAASLGTHWVYERAAVEQSTGGALGNSGDLCEAGRPALFLQIYQIIAQNGGPAILR